MNVKFLKSDFFILLIIFILGVCYLKLENSIILSGDFNVDERLWIKRSFNYINFVKDLNFLEAIQTVHPGITVMLLSGIFIHIADFFWGGDFKNLYYINLYKVALNIPIVLFISIFYFSFYYILRKLKFDKILAFLVLIIFSINLYYIFESTPVDKFATISILLSLSFLLIYVNNKFTTKKYLFLSSFFAGFGVLSKLSALILIPFNFFILLYFSPLNSEKYKGAIKDFILFIFLFFGTIIFIFPGFVISPIESVNAIIGSKNNLLVSVFEHSPEKLSLLKKAISYFSFFTKGNFTPLATGLLLIFIIFTKSFYKEIKSEFSEENLFSKNILILFIFCFVYFFYTIIFTNFIYYRYLIPSFLILDIGAAIGFYKIILWYRNKYKIQENINSTAIKFALLFYILQFTHLTVVYYYSHIL